MFILYSFFIIRISVKIYKSYRSLPNFIQNKEVIFLHIANNSSSKVSIIEIGIKKEFRYTHTQVTPPTIMVSLGPRKLRQDGASQLKVAKTAQMTAREMQPEPLKLGSSSWMLLITTCCTQIEKDNNERSYSSDSQHLNLGGALVISFHTPRNLYIQYI